MLHRLDLMHDWHGEQAAKAYREGDTEAYVRHIAIADKLWRA